MSDRLIRGATAHPALKADRRGFLGSAVRGALVISSAPGAATSAVAADVSLIDVRSLVSRLDEDGPPDYRVAPELADRSLLVKTGDAPAEQVRQEAAHLLDAVWLSEQGRTRMTLVRDARARAHRLSLVEKVYREALLDIHTQIKRTVEPPAYFQELMKPENRKQAERLFRDGNIRYLVDEGVHAALSLLKMLPPEALLTGLRAGRLYLRYRDLSPEGKVLLVQAADIFSRPHRIHRQQVDDWRMWATAFGLVYWFVVDPAANGLGTANYRVGHGNMPIWYPTPRLRAAWASGAPARGNPNSTRREAPGDSSFAPLERIKFPKEYIERTVTTWRAELIRLAPLLSYRVYSEELPSNYFGIDRTGVTINPAEETGDPARLPLREMSLADGLDALCKRHRRVWWRAGDALFFRSWTWHLDEELVVPADLLTTLQHEIAEIGKLSLETLRSLAGLTLRQLEGLNWLGRSAALRNGPGPNDAGHMQAVLQVFASLSAKEQEQVFSPDGLPASAFSPQVSAHLAELVYVRGGGPELLKRREYFRISQRPLHAPAAKHRVVSLEARLGETNRWPYGWIYLAGLERRTR